MSSDLNFINNVNMNIEDGLKQFSFIDNYNSSVIGSGSGNGNCIANIKLQTESSNDKKELESEDGQRDSDVQRDSE